MYNKMIIYNVEYNVEDNVYGHRQNYGRKKKRST